MIGENEALICFYFLRIIVYQLFLLSMSNKYNKGWGRNAKTIMSELSVDKPYYV